MPKTENKAFNSFPSGEDIAIIVMSLSLVFIIFSRIYRGFHSFFDMGVTIGASTFIFWIFYLVLFTASYFAINKSNKSKKGYNEKSYWDFFLLFNYKPFIVITCVSVPLMVFFTIPLFTQPYSPNKNALIIKLTYFIDPLIVQMLSLALCAIVVTKNLIKKKFEISVDKLKNIGIFLKVFITIGILLVGVFAIEYLMLKPSFNHTPLGQHMPESPLTYFILPHHDSFGNSCPSGFLLRQSVLMWIALFFYSRLRINGEKENKIEEKMNSDFIRVSSITVAATCIFVPMLIIFCRDIQYWIIARHCGFLDNWDL